MQDLDLQAQPLNLRPTRNGLAAALVRRALSVVSPSYWSLLNSPPTQPVEEEPPVHALLTPAPFGATLSARIHKGVSPLTTDHPMLGLLRSLWVWIAVVTLILLWVPLLAIIRLFDRDEVHYTTGRWFRRLGVAMTVVNPFWRLHVTGFQVPHERQPFVVVSNHQSMADIPLLSHIPWEMKWIAKVELFRVPAVGWMMQLAGDIPVERKDARSGARALIRAARVLERLCPVMFFPEGTRSPDGRVGRFTDGAFHLAIRAKVPILPIVVDGSYDALPKHSWRFGSPKDIRVHLLEPVSSAGYASDQAGALRDTVRAAIMETLSGWRGVAPDQVDALAPRAQTTVRPDAV
jgi:1-acyl-sn-glycerol-3-phosphate acyltransferase